MKIVKDIEIMEKKVYFTTFAAVVLFIIIAGCVSTQPHSTLVPTEPQPTPTLTPTFSPPPQEKLPGKTFRPISVVASVQFGPWPTGPGGEISPAGPPSWVTVTVNASSTDVPVIQLSTTVLDYDRMPIICDNFGINEKKPLMPGQNVSTACGYRSLGAPVDLFIVNGTAAVLVEGTLQNGQSFSYWTNDTTSYNSTNGVPITVPTTIVTIALTPIITSTSTSRELSIGASKPILILNISTNLTVQNTPMINNITFEQSTIASSYVGRDSVPNFPEIDVSARINKLESTPVSFWAAQHINFNENGTYTLKLFFKDGSEPKKGDVLIMPIRIVNTNGAIVYKTTAFYNWE